MIDCHYLISFVLFLYYIMGTTKHILLFGAGKSATVLINYLGKITQKNNWICTIADIDLPTIEAKIYGVKTLLAKEIQINDAEARKSIIEKADVVISMLPPALHYLVATDCLILRKHLLTASYIDSSIRNMEKDIEAAGLLFLGEMGLDPGIDHMSAMKMIHHIQAQGGHIHSFKSHCGGLVAPESDTNPWHYKISWNPRNIVTAGKAGAIYREDHEIKEVTYQQIFENCKEITVKDLGQLSFYPNRDSLSYIPVYGLENVATFIRTTLRYPAFCSGWEKIVAAGFTNDDITINTDGMSYTQFFHEILKDKIIEIQGNIVLNDQFNYLGMNNHHLINKGIQPIANVLQQLLEEKWKLSKGDKDLIVMKHEIDYTLFNKNHHVNSTLLVKGDDELNTAMAKTVGLPLGIAATLLLENKLTVRGLHIPIIQEIYDPVLSALEQEGIVFDEEDTIV